MKVSELVSNKPPKILLYGEVGSGKTALALTLGARAQVVDMDDGLRTGVSLQDNFTNDRKAVDVKQFIETNPTKQAIAFLQVKKYIYGLPAEIQSGKWKFEALILDSLSAFADSAVRYIMSNSGRIDETPEIQHWGLAFNEIKNVMNVIRTLPCVVILIGHDQVKSVGKGVHREEKLELAISGKNLPSQITRYFDEVWYMRARNAGGGKREYVLQTVGDEIVPARSRACLPTLTNTNIGMWELIKKLGYTPKEVKQDAIKT